MAFAVANGTRFCCCFALGTTADAAPKIYASGQLSARHARGAGCKMSFLRSQLGQTSRKSTPYNASTSLTRTCDLGYSENEVEGSLVPNMQLLAPERVPDFRRRATLATSSLFSLGIKPAAKILPIQEIRGTQTARSDQCGTSGLNRW